MMLAFSLFFYLIYFLNQIYDWLELNFCRLFCMNFSF